MIKASYVPSAAARSVVCQIMSGNGLWTKGWISSDLHAMKPFNPISGTVYSDDNAVRLYLPLLEMFRFDPSMIIDLRFSTLNQLEKHGATVREGSIGYTVVFAIPASDGEECQDAKPQMRSRIYTVYNYRDVIWRDQDQRLKYDAYSFNSYGAQSLSSNRNAESMLKNCGARIVTCHTIQPSFVPHENTIYMPLNADFSCESRKWETLLHELMHWTKFNLPGCRRSYGYAQEEIVAQLGAVMLCQELGVNFVPGQKEGMLDYLKSWIRPLQPDDRLYVVDDALESAETAVKRLLTFI